MIDKVIAEHAAVSNLHKRFYLLRIDSDCSNT
jgi:hypothetical protein